MKQKIQQILEWLLKDEEEIHKQLQMMHSQTAGKINAVLSRFFVEYGDGSQLEMSDLTKPLNARERRKYPKRIKTRLDALRYEIEQILNEDRRIERREINAFQAQTVQKIYKDLEKKPGDNAKPVRSSDISDILTKNKDLQAAAVISLITSFLIQGRKAGEITSEIEVRYTRRADNEFRRLVYTEDTFLVNETIRKINGSDTYTYLTANDSKVCETCRALHGRTFKYSERITGINYPPMHPWCRCIAVPNGGRS